MMRFSCHCGQVRVTVAARPEYIHECNCSLCNASGAWWGYFDPGDITVEGPTTGYCRHDKDEPAAVMRFCAQCGSTTHFVLTESAAARFGNTLMGVNLRLADAQDLAGIELRYPDGAGWDGVGAFGYVREARVLG